MTKYLGVALLLSFVALAQSDCDICDCRDTGATQTVDCKNRNPKLTEQPSGIAATAGLLDLSDNELTQLDTTTFYRLEQLTRLNLNNNRLTTVDISALASLPELNRLDLEDNQIASIEGTDELPDTTALKNIFLKNNPLICDCSLLKFRDWAKENSVKLHQAKCGPGNDDVTKSVESIFGDGSCAPLYPPGPVTVKFVTSRGATVSWTSSTIGVPALSYKVFLSPDLGLLNIPRVVSATEPLSTQISGLTPGQEYTVIVESVRGNIASGSSDAKFTTIPLSPLEVTVTAIQTTNALITWSSPSQGVYSGFNISFQPPDSSILVSPPILNGGQRMARVSRLSAGTAYTFSLLTTSGVMGSVPVLRSFTTLGDENNKCSVCDNVTRDASCTVDTCSAGENGCRTHVSLVDRQWMISKQCMAMTSCEKPNEVKGVSFTICCSGKKEGQETCNSHTNFTAWVEEVPLEVVLVLKPEVSDDDENLDSAFRGLVSSVVGGYITVGERTFDSATRQLTYAMTGSFLKGATVFSIQTMNAAMSRQTQPGGQLAPYADQGAVARRTLTPEGAKCPAEVTRTPEGRTYQWPSVPAGETALVPCSSDEDNSATRSCLQIQGTKSAEWGQPNMSKCQTTQQCDAETMVANGQSYLWPITLVGSVSVLPCSVDDRENSVHRPCELTGLGPNWGTADFGACQQPEPTCAAEETTEGVTKYAWPQTKIGATARLPCPDDQQKSVTRACEQAEIRAEWALVDTSQCGGGQRPTCAAERTEQNGQSYQWPATIVGNAATVPCSGEDRSKRAVRLCLVGPLWSSEVNFEACKSQPVAFCPAENITTDRGQFTWPETETGKTTRVQCPLTDKPRTAFRRCLPSEISPIWKEPVVVACPRINDQATDTLRALNAKPVTVDNVVFVTTAMAEISQNTTGITSEDVSLIGQLINSVVQSESAFDGDVQSESSVELVTAVSNLMSMSSEQLGPAERKNKTLKSVVRSMEKFAQGLSVQNKLVTLVQGNLAISSVKVRKGQTVSIAVKTDGQTLQKSDVMVGVAADNTMSGVSLPEELFSAEDGKAAFVIYNKNTFFQTMAASDSHEPEVLPVGIVISASTGSKRENLASPVAVTIKHPIKAANETPRCVYWDFELSNGSGNWSTRGCRVGRSTNRSTVCECDHMTNFALLMDVYGMGEVITGPHQDILSVLSLVGCALSLLGLILTVITYLMFRRKLLKNMPSKILLNLCFALIGVNAVFLGGTHYTVDDALCKIVAGLLHYFLLASFCWMLVEAFYMYLSLVRVFQTYFSKLIWKFCVFAWGAPLIVVIITISISRENYGLQNEKICWLPQLAFYIAFMAPLILILVSNFIAFIMVLHQLRAVMSRKKLTRAETQSTTSQLRAALSILVLLGLTWLFGFLAIGGATIVFAYLFAIFNTLQGLLIFIFYCVWKRDVQIAWMRSLSCCPDVDESTSKSRYKVSSDEWFKVKVRSHRPSLTTTLSGSGAPGGPSFDDGMVRFVSYRRASSSLTPSIDLGGFDSQYRGLRLGPDPCQQRMISSMWGVDSTGDSSTTAYRKSKGSFGTTFTSFQKDSTPQRKFSESTEITDQPPPSTTTFAHVNNHNVYGVKSNGNVNVNGKGDVNVNGNGNGDVNVNVNGDADDYDVCGGLNANTIDLSLEPGALTSHDDVMTKSVEVEENNATVV